MIFVPVILLAQSPVSPAMYSWQKPDNEIAPGLFSSVLFEGLAHDFEFLQMSANTMAGNIPPVSRLVPSDEEHLILLKDGVLTISFNDSTWSIGKGSIALLLPETRYVLQNQSADSCSFQVMKYRSRYGTDLKRGQAHGGSFVRDWKKIPFYPHNRGGIRNYCERPTAMAKRFEMHVTTLKEGIKSHEPHTHRAEEIVLILDNKTEMQIGNSFFRGGAGDIYFLASNVPHAIQNIGTSPCIYFAFQFE